MRFRSFEQLFLTFVYGNTGPLVDYWLQFLFTS
jgi:hypothetical protein